MTRRMLGSFFFLLLSWPSVSTAQEPLRVFYTGHSFHMFVPQRMKAIVKAAGNKEYQTVGTSGIGGSRVIQHWNKADDTNTAKKILEKGGADVFTMAPHLIIPDEGIDNFVALGLKHNPKMRFLVQQSWVPRDGLENFIKKLEQRNETNLVKLRAEQTKWTDLIEAQVKAINKKVGRDVVAIVPVGYALIDLREQVVAGKVPGVAKQADLFNDLLGHGKAEIQILTTYCTYVCITGRNPSGLKVEDASISPELHAVLQRIAWEAVTKYPMSGVKAPK